MALKDLLVYVDQTPSAPARLLRAIDLARRNGSHLTALFVNVMNDSQQHKCATAELARVPAARYAELRRDIEETIANAAAELRAMLESAAAEYRLDTEWRCVDGVPETVVHQHARYRDLCVLGHPDLGNTVPVDYGFSEHVLFISGRPVLLVPTGDSGDTLGRHVVVAWNSSRVASRALNDALPLIESCDRTTVLCVNPSHYIEQYCALPPEELIEHLARHGIRAELVRMPNVPNGSVADVLQSEALRRGADMLVAGAFGHAKITRKAPRRGHSEYSCANASTDLDVSLVFTRALVAGGECGSASLKGQGTQLARGRM